MAVEPDPAEVSYVAGTPVNAVLTGGLASTLYEVYVIEGVANESALLATGTTSGAGEATIPFVMPAPFGLSPWALVARTNDFGDYHSSTLSFTITAAPGGGGGRAGIGVGVGIG
jgi:hypothetical protein